MQLWNSYAELPSSFFQKTEPVPVRAPQLLLWNAPLAEDLGIPQSLTEDRERIARIFSGNELLSPSEPMALAYAGHQFGHFVPQLGDGRAHLLGEIVDPAGDRWDVQLKGSGPTGFSRGGDGRCALGPAVRELVMSEAMHALGVPTTRSLAVVATGEPVIRETALPGAIVTRIAASHLRVGTFEYFAARGDRAALAKLLDYAVERHYPELERGPDLPLAFLSAVITRQIELVVHWMRVGFIHGVMNTDNTAISGQTIDFGPCAMMGTYDPKTVYSSIDRRGRYAYGNQPFIAAWNMVRLAETLLPLIDENENTAIEKVTPLLDSFPKDFGAAWSAMMRKKLGLSGPPGEDDELVTELLERMEQNRLDYTVTFDELRTSLDSEAGAEALGRKLGDWYGRWRARIGDDARQTMARHNPVVIPRNHHVEAVLAAAVEEGDVAPAERFLDALRSPYEVGPNTPDYQDPPADGDIGYRTFCGT